MELGQKKKERKRKKKKKEKENFLKVHRRIKELFKKEKTIYTYLYVYMCIIHILTEHFLGSSSVLSSL